MRSPSDPHFFNQDQTMANHRNMTDQELEREAAHLDAIAESTAAEYAAEREADLEERAEEYAAERQEEYEADLAEERAAELAEAIEDEEDEG